VKHRQIWPFAFVGDDSRPRDFRIVFHDDSAPEIFIYDEIGYWGITAADFARALQSLDTDAFTVRLNSPGGEVFDGIAIYNAIKQHRAHVTVQVDGLAASAASFIAQAGDEVVMTKNATMMIHDGMGMVMGNASDMRKQADVLDKASDNIASIYAERTGMKTEEWRAFMLAETWYNADEAVAAGLADRIYVDEPKEAPKNDFAEQRKAFRFERREVAPAPTIFRPTNRDPIVPPVAEPEPAPVLISEPDTPLDTASFADVFRSVFRPEFFDADDFADNFRTSMRDLTGNVPIPDPPQADPTPRSTFTLSELADALREALT